MVAFRLGRFSSSCCRCEKTSGRSERKNYLTELQGCFLENKIHSPVRKFLPLRACSRLSFATLDSFAMTSMLMDCTQTTWIGLGVGAQNRRKRDASVLALKWALRLLDLNCHADEQVASSLRYVCATLSERAMRDHSQTVHKLKALARRHFRKYALARLG